jgi:hypothetical protein
MKQARLAQINQDKLVSTKKNKSNNKNNNDGDNNDSENNYSGRNRKVNDNR